MELPYLENEAVSRYGLRGRRQASDSDELFSFDQIKKNRKNLIGDFQTKIEKASSS
jgi:spore maturation protein CgeB